VNFKNVTVSPCRPARKIFAILLLVAPFAAFGAEDLLHQYRLAVQRDPKLRSAEANRNAVDERRAQAQAAFLPTITASGTRNKNRENVRTEGYIYSQPPGEAYFYDKQYRVSLSQPVLHAELLAGYQAASADLRQAEAQYVAAVQELMVRVAQAYFDVLAAEDALALATAEKNALAHQMESARERLKGGLVPITDVRDAEAAYENALSQEIEAHNQVADKREAIAEITGTRPADLAPLGRDLPLALPDPSDILKWTDAAARQNPGIEAASAAVASARETVSQMRAGHYPTLDFVSTRSRSQADASISGPGVSTDNTVTGLQLTIPLFQGGMVNARTQEAAWRYEAAQQELEARRRNVERTARSSFLGVSGGIAKIGALKQSVAAASESLDAKTEGYRAGLYTMLDVLNATRDLFRTQRDLAQARYEYVLSLLQLKQAAGTLREQDLAALNGWLQNGETKPAP
jgi:outer membrane protein